MHYRLVRTFACGAVAVMLIAAVASAGPQLSVLTKTPPPLDSEPLLLAQDEAPPAPMPPSKPADAADAAKDAADAASDAADAANDAADAVKDAADTVEDAADDVPEAPEAPAEAPAEQPIHEGAIAAPIVAASIACPPCVSESYRHRAKKKMRRSCVPAMRICLPTCNPQNGCTVAVPVCLPGCVTGAPCVVDSRCGMFGRGIVTYCFDCGYKLTVTFDKCGDVKVVHHG